MNLQNQNTYSISNLFIVLSLFSTIIVLTYTEYYAFGMNSFFLERQDYITYILQFFSSQFLHGSYMHFLFNAVFIYIFGNMVENILGTKRYLLFFLLSSVVIGIALTLFSSGNTVGISGFAMALLSFYTVDLYYKQNIDYKGGLTAIIINIGIGITPGISLVGHFSGAVAGVIFYFIYIYSVKK